MIQPIYLYGSDVLREVAQPVSLEDKENIARLVGDLKETLKQAEGCGLAAPQIGVSSRVVIVDGDDMQDVYPYLKGFRRTLINPVVISESEETCDFDEGCLSVPGIFCSVRRPSSITVEYYDESLSKVTETFDKFGCRMVQHELSHLDGVLFTDLVAPIRRKMISSRMQNISRGRVPVAYKAKIKR